MKPISFSILRFLHFRADAKALVCLVLLYPEYPQPVLGHVLPAYASFTFPFFINTLLLAAVVSLAIPLLLLFRNAAKGDAVLPFMFLGYRKNLDDVVLEKEWLIQYPADDGTPVRLKKLGSSDDGQMLESARTADATSSVSQHRSCLSAQTFPVSKHVCKQEGRKCNRKHR